MCAANARFLQCRTKKMEGLSYDMLVFCWKAWANVQGQLLSSFGQPAKLYHEVLFIVTLQCQNFWFCMLIWKVDITMQHKNYPQKCNRHGAFVLLLSVHFKFSHDFKRSQNVSILNMLLDSRITHLRFSLTLASYLYLIIIVVTKRPIYHRQGHT
jgi:hypothetical protein